MNNSRSARKILFGAYSTALIIIVIIAAILLNILIARIESNNAFKLDLTKNKVYSLSKITTDMLTTLDKDIYLYYFVPTSFEGDKNVMLLNELLNKYAAGGRRIHVKKLDPLVEIGLVNKFTRLDTPFPTKIAVVVSQGNAEEDADAKFRPPIDADTLIDVQTGDVIAERIITGAILSFNQSQTTNLWYLSGHGKFLPDIKPDTRNYLEVTGYNVNKIILPADNAKLLPNDVLLMGGLESDLSQDEANTIESFIDKGGNIVVLFDDNKATFPIFTKLLGKYKIKVEEGIILEQSPQYLYDAKARNVILTDRSEHAITKGINANNPIILQSARSIMVEDVNLETGELDFSKYHGVVSSLISSSASSYLKKISDTNTDLDYVTGDKTGPFNVGLTYELSQSNGITSRITLFGSTSLYYFPSYDVPGDFGLFVNSVNWAAEKESLNIAGKVISQKNLEINDLNLNTVNIVSFIVILLVPVLILGMGLFVWIRRKNR